MGNEKITHRAHDGVGEVRLEEDGTYSWRLFEYDISRSGYHDLSHAESQMETQWMTENAKRSGQWKSGKRNQSIDVWYSSEALEWLRKKWT